MLVLKLLMQMIPQYVHSTTRTNVFRVVCLFAMWTVECSLLYVYSTLKGKV